MKKIFLILSLIFSEALSDSLNINTSNWGTSFSLGICAEKTSLSTHEFSLIRYIDNQSEFYGTLSGFIIFSGNFGFGYRHYFKSRYEPSFFSGISISKCFAINHGSLGDDAIDTFSGVNLTFGKSFRSNSFTNLLMRILMFPFLGPIPVSDRGNSFINLGIVLSSYDIYSESKNKLSLVPTINLEIRNN
tara:strand:- start:433 stop:999 length:567 start_codon:yes stop_codon:yes gene_type:complete